MNVPNYNDIAKIKTPTKHRNDAQIAMVQADMKRIDSVLALGGEEELKVLHIDLDGTYQNLIKNWGSSTYNYIQGHGYTYEYMGESALRDNLITIRGKLRGFLLQLSPNAEDVFSVDAMSVVNSDSLATNEEKSAALPSRANMYDIIKGRKFDVVKEYARIWNLFNTADIVGPRATSLSSYINACLQFFPDSFKGRALTLEDFNNTYGFRFPNPNELVTEDELISYCEYVITLCNYLWKYAVIHLDDEAEYLKEDLYNTVESCMDELGLISVNKDEITIFVDKDPAVITVAELVDETLMFDVKAFIHKQTKGDLEKKKTILKYLADEIEPKRKILNANNQKGLADLLFQMFQKFVRHNNDDNEYISNMSLEELEECYYDIYQLWLLAKLEIDNIERKQRTKKLLGEINTPST